MQVEETRLTYISDMVAYIQVWIKPASKVLNLIARFSLRTTYFNIHSLQFVKLLASSNNNKLSLIVSKKESVMDQPAPDLLNTTFHRTDCIFLGCVTNRFETQINLCVVGIAMHVWEMILNYLE